MSLSAGEEAGSGRPLRPLRVIFLSQVHPLNHQPAFCVRSFSAAVRGSFPWRLRASLCLPEEALCSRGKDVLLHILVWWQCGAGGRSGGARLGVGLLGGLEG